jgi:outer membrane immunogenic protein
VAFGPPNNGDIVAQLQQTPPRSIDSSARWTGFYLGGNVGYGSTRGGGGVTCLNSVTNSSSGCDIINSPALHTSGVFGGGQLGYMMPLSGLNLPLGPNMPSLMIGVEADIQPSAIGGTQNVSGPFNFVDFPGFTCSPCSFSASQQIDWFSTVRGRIGVPIDDFLLYGTGGIMLGSVRASQSLNFLGSPQGNLGTVKRGADGPVFGGGVEVLLPGPFSAKFEGLYYDLGDLKTVGLPVNGAPTNFTDFKTFGFHGALFRAGINMRLGGLGGT